MADQPLTEESIAARRSLGKWLMYGGIGFLLFGIYISVFMVPDAITAASGPQALTLAEAADAASGSRTYAEIQDGAYDCATAVEVRGFAPRHTRYGTLREETKLTEIFFTDESREVVILVALSGEVDCAALGEERPSGYLYMMDDDTRQELTNEARLARYFEADTFLEFCGYCGLENSLIGATFGVVSLVGGLAMTIGGRRMKKANTV